MLYESLGTLFHPSLFKEIANTIAWHNKPCGGFWASPCNSPNRWERWCAENQCPCDPDTKTVFEIDRKAKILRITSPDDYAKAARLYPLHEKVIPTPDASLLDYVLLEEAGENPTAFIPLDYERIRRDGVQVLEVRPAELRRRHCGAPLHSWDCDTTLIMDPTVICHARYYLDGRLVPNLTQEDLKCLARFVKLGSWLKLINRASSL